MNRFALQAIIVIVIIVVLFALAGCGGDSGSSEQATTTQAEATGAPRITAEPDPERGEPEERTGVLAIAPGTIAFTFASGSEPGSRKAFVTNLSDSSVSFSPGHEVGWIQIAPEAATLAPGEGASLDVTIDSANLPEGTHTALIRLNDSNSAVYYAETEVTAEVAAEDAFVLSLPSAAASCGDEVILDLTVQNSPSVEAFGVDVNFDGDCLEFLGAEPGEMTMDWAATLGREARPGSLKVGGFRGMGTPFSGSGTVMQLRFRCRSGACPCLGTIELANPIDGVKDGLLQHGSLSCYRVTAGPALSVSPERITLTAAANEDPVERTVSLVNAGTGVLSGTVATAVDWIEVLTPQFSTPDSFEARFTVDASALSPGEHRATIEIAAPSSQESPVGIPVVVTVVSGEGAQLVFGEETGVCGELMQVPVMVQGVRDFQAFGFMVHFNPASVEFVAADAGMSTQRWAAVQGQVRRAGMVAIGGFRGMADPITGDGEIAMLTFRCREGRCPGETVLDATDLTDGLANVEIVKGVVRCAEETAFRDFELRPSILEPVFEQGSRPESLAIEIGPPDIYSPSRGKPLTIQVEDDAEWLSLDPTEITFDSSAAAEVAALFAIEDLEPGTYNAAITVTDTLYPENTDTAVVRMTIEEATPALVEIGTATALCGEPVTVPILAEFVDDMTEFTLTLNFDPECLSYVSTRRGIHTETWPQFTVNETEPGLLEISASRPDGGETMGAPSTLALIDFQCRENTEEYQPPRCPCETLVSGASAAGDLEDADILMGIILCDPPEAEVPVIAVDPPSIEFSTTEGEEPPAQSFTITNTGRGTMSYAVTDNKPWLAMEPFAGRLEGGESQTVSLRIGGGQRPPAVGLQEATIVVRSQSAENSPVEIPVRMEVKAPSSGVIVAIGSAEGKCGQRLQVPISVERVTSPMSAFGMTVTYDAQCLDFITGTKASKTSDWAGVVGNEISPGTLRVGGFRGAGTPLTGAGDVVILEFICKEDDCGCETVVTPAGMIDGLAGAQAVPGTIGCGGGAAIPSIGLQPSEIRAVAEAGDEDASAGFTVLNYGGGELRFTARPRESWMTLSSTEGRVTDSPSSIQVSFDVSMLEEGTHTGEIEIDAVRADNAPQTIPVTLVVNSGGAAGVSIGSQNGSCNGTITVPVNVRNASGLSAWGLTVGYDSSCLTFVSASSGSLTSGWAAILGNAISPGTIRVGGFRGAAVQASGSGSLATLTFRCGCDCSSNLTILSAIDDLQGASTSGGRINCGGGSDTGSDPDPGSGTGGGSPGSGTGEGNNPDPGPSPDPGSGTGGGTPGSGTGGGLPGSGTGGGTPGVVNPEFRINPAGFGLAAERGEVHTAILTVRHVGDTSADYRFVSDANWLTVSPASGILGFDALRATVSANADGLEQGTYGATLRIESNTAVNAPISIPISFAVTNDRVNDFTLVVGSATAGCGEEVSVPVTIIDSEEFSSFGFDLDYSEGCLDFVRAESGNGTTTWASILGNETQPGRIRVGGFRGAGAVVSGSAEIARLVFRTQPSSCTCRSNLTPREILDGIIGADRVAGEIEVRR